MRELVLIVLGVTALSAIAAVGAPGASKPAPKYVGPEICMQCHIDYAKLWATVKHSQALLKTDLPADQRGCEACHGPGGDHAAGNRKQIVRFDQLDLEHSSAVCLKCHQKLDVTTELWTQTSHAKVLTCPVCHEVHRPTKRDHLLKNAEGKDCSPCHDDLADKIKAKQHHTLADGALECGSCHNFHGSPNEHQLVKPQGELCKDCHGDDVPKPDSHKSKDWKLHHGADAKGHQTECYVCHSEKTFCNQCHATKVPHPEGFAMDHKAAAQQHPDTCLRCHEPDFCKMCHEQVPAPVGKGTEPKP